jgi:hypothetical protein
MFSQTISPLTTHNPFSKSKNLFKLEPPQQPPTGSNRLSDLTDSTTTSSNGLLTSSQVFTSGMLNPFKPPVYQHKKSENNEPNSLTSSCSEVPNLLIMSSSSSSTNNDSKWEAKTSRVSSNSFLKPNGATFSSMLFDSKENNSLVGNTAAMTVDEFYHEAPRSFVRLS